jgi:NAD/NADP transhydrogenase beta subunit
LCSTGFTLNSTSNNCTAAIANTTSSTVSTAQATAVQNDNQNEIIAALVLAVLGIVIVGVVGVGGTIAFRNLRGSVDKISTGQKYAYLSSPAGLTEGQRFSP